MKHCWSLVQGGRGCRKGLLQTATIKVIKKILLCSVSREVMITALISCLCLKDQLGLCSINCFFYAITGNCSASLRVLPENDFYNDRKSAFSVLKCYCFSIKLVSDFHG